MFELKRTSILLELRNIITGRMSINNAAEILSHLNTVCEHRKAIVVKLTDVKNKFYIRLQCLECGSKLGYPHSCKDIIEKESLPFYSITYKNEMKLRIKKEQDEYKQYFIDNYPKYTGHTWREIYNEYLNSILWGDLRLKALSRDNYLCQFCNKSKAEAVHHLTYDNYNRLGHSTLDEIKSICNKCHFLMHKDDLVIADEY